MRKILQSIVIQAYQVSGTKMEYVNREVDLVATPAVADKPNGEQVYYLNIVLPLTKDQYERMAAR